ncbi:MAG: hypothetical protein CVV27_04080 [Candidatus Melainabacteria bacterium HGW-Melainabacteria-1]|nr:MAG: hypothetical protein CVV27_04080 [Candidatus Melainabacteria bacterium HGW-Melainabacteria-1]
MLPRLSLLILFAILFQTPVAAAEPASCKAYEQAQISFESHETLFTVLAWLNWLGDRDEPLELSEYDPIQTDLLEEIKQSQALKALYPTHRAAYETYLKGFEPYVKNGLLLMDSLYYGPAPSFRQAPSTALSMLSPHDLERIQSMPSAALLAEFYQALNIQQRWSRHYKPAYDKYTEQYRHIALAGIKRAQCFLKVAPQAPVTVLFNPLDAFGTSGQTSYDPVQKRHLLKLHIDLKYATPESVENTAAHEYTHALMNPVLATYQQAFQTKLDSIAQTAKQPELGEVPIQELFARSVGYLKSSRDSSAVRDLRAYYGSNPILLHLLAQEAAYQQSGKPFDAYVPEFLASFDPVSMSQAWQALHQRVQANLAPSPKALEQLEKHGLKQADLLAAIAANQATLSAKLNAFYALIGGKVAARSPEDLLFQCFEHAHYVPADSYIRENVFRIYQNPLYYHFSELLKPSQDQPLEAQAFVRQLSLSFDAAQEAKRWQAVEQRLQAEDQEDDSP